MDCCLHHRVEFDGWGIVSGEMRFSSVISIGK